jgi:carboxymethylenebutenolidase
MPRFRFAAQGGLTMTSQLMITAPSRTPERQPLVKRLLVAFATLALLAAGCIPGISVNPRSLPKDYSHASNPLRAASLKSSGFRAGARRNGNAPLAARAQAEPAPKKVDTFTAGGKSIRVERFNPKARGKHPVVLLLHDSNGLKANGSLYRSNARMLAGQGYVVFLVHYLDRTGIEQINRKDLREDTFLAYMDTVRQAVLYARRQPGVDPKRVGLVGVSLGAYLALAVAAQPELKIAAVVDLFGGLPAKYRKTVRSLPPTLILHGDADKVVPVEEAYALCGFMVANRFPCEIKIYRGLGHCFLDAQGKFQLGKALDAQYRAIAFLKKHLKGDSTKASR